MKLLIFTLLLSVQFVYSHPYGKHQSSVDVDPFNNYPDPELYYASDGVAKVKICLAYEDGYPASFKKRILYHNPINGEKPKEDIVPYDYTKTYVKRPQPHFCKLATYEEFWSAKKVKKYIEDYALLQFKIVGDINDGRFNDLLESIKKIRVNELEEDMKKDIKKAVINEILNGEKYRKLKSDIINEVLDVIDKVR